MAHYAIGDLQGCLNEFEALLAEIGFTPGRDTLWLTGDLVNRGPASLAVLRLVKHYDTCMHTVLGNHDLHLLAMAYGYARPKRGDTVGDILAAPDRSLLLDWLRAQPLLIRTPQYLLAHAGIWPQWSADTAAARAADIEHALQTKPEDYFAHMYGNRPLQDTAPEGSHDARRFTTNAFTRMRAVTLAGDIDFDFKSTLGQLPAHLRPWFAHAQRVPLAETVVFGHWSALGLYRGHGVLALDTGALWGGSLTAANLGSGEIIQVPSQNRRAPV